MTLLLDTSLLIDIERRFPPTIAKLKELSKTYPLPARITVVNEFEFLLGIQEKSPKNKEKAVAFLNNFTVLQTTKQTAGILTNLKHKYDKKGIVLSLADLLIASLAIENNRILVTKDHDFKEIEELRIISV